MTHLRWPGPGRAKASLSPRQRDIFQPDRHRPASARQAATPIAIGVAILAAYLAFTLATLPKPSDFRILAINRAISDSMSHALATDWTRPFWPMEYEMRRIYWLPTTLFPTYAAEQALGPLGSYLLFSSIFIAVAFGVALYLTRSAVFSTTLAFMFAFGTQLNYVYTYGSLIPLYLTLTYCAANLALVVLLVRGRLNLLSGLLGFVISLWIIALSSEWWINYAIALVCACTFGFFWARRHDRPETTRACAVVAASTIGVLAVYLSIRLQYPAQFVRFGEEEELIVTYASFVMMAEDLVANFFTFLYMTLDNYLPSFVSSSNSLTYLGPATILAEQHGYHAQYQHLVLMSHLFLWRFYAGVAVTVFLALLARAAARAWSAPDWHHAVIVALMLMVMTAFSTHLLIKMRPYNSVPGLSYKVVLSVSAFTILVSYLVMTACRRLSSDAARGILLVCVWTCVFSAALTRPAMQAKLLEQVGLVGFRDPLGQIMSLGAE
jgi:hypothetical protein